MWHTSAYGCAAYSNSSAVLIHGYDRSEPYIVTLANVAGNNDRSSS